MPRLMLIDGNSLTYRAFFALPTDLATAGGQVTNAVYGFTSMLVNLVRDHEPDHVVVAFDRPEPTFRHERLDSYKANRAAAPDILREQMGLVRQVVDVLGLPVIEVPGFEADDIIATLARRAEADNWDVLVVTGDRDSFQLVRDPHVRVLYNKRGVSDYALYDEAGIVERTGVRADQYVIYAALRGDPSDNLPGIPGVGEKTAAKLVATYGDLDGIFSHLDDQTPKLRENLAAHEGQARMNAELMVLREDAPIDTSLDSLHRGAIDEAELKRLFDFLEFTSLLPRVADAFGFAGATAAATPAVAVPVIALADDAATALAGLARVADGVRALAVAPAWSGPEGRSDLLALALAPMAAGPVGGESGAEAPVDGPEAAVTVLTASALADPGVRSALAAIFDESGPPLWAHDAKPLMRALLPLGVDIRTLRLDTAVAAYLIEPSDSRYLLRDLAARYGGVQLPDGAEAPEGQLDFGTGGPSATERAAIDAVGVLAAGPALLEALSARGLADLNRSIEVPLVRVLARMEVLGIGVDRSGLRALSDSLLHDCEALKRQIWEDAGGEFNVNSTPQLREVLFDRLGLAPQKKTKTGYSTDASSLEKLVGTHPIVEHLLRYREVEKLRSTYGEGLLHEVAADGRIHATFNQTVARTGRLSSDAPNLHNIPVRSELGRRFRSVFVPAEGHRFLVADYNQIELRCIAHLSEDPGLVRAFESGDDIHRAVASRVFGVPAGEVTFEQRNRAKMVSYGLAYGMEAYGLGQRLSIDTGEAQGILDAYFGAFPGVATYMDRVVAEARDRGYTETLFGRRRQIPELSSSNFRIRQAGERQAKNAGIQGLAADIFKVALVRLDAVLEEQHRASRVVLQVHDEVLLEVPPEEEAEVEALTVATMREAFPLRVPLEVNVATGATWAEAKA